MIGIFLGRSSKQRMAYVMCYVYALRLKHGKATGRASLVYVKGKSR